jgi:uncharacterized protein (TIGR02246 family)
MRAMPTDEQAIRDLFAAWKQATLDKDVDTLLTFITDDAVFLAPGQPPIRGKSAVEAMYRQMLSLYLWEQNWVFEEIQVFGEWAFCWGHDSATITPLDGGPAVSASGVGLSILHKRPDGSWAVARGINNMTRQTT